MITRAFIFDEHVRRIVEVEYNHDLEVLSMPQRTLHYPEHLWNELEQHAQPANMPACDRLGVINPYRVAEVYHHSYQCRG